LDLLGAAHPIAAILVVDVCDIEGKIRLPDKDFRLGATADFFSAAGFTKDNLPDFLEEEIGPGASSDDDDVRGGALSIIFTDSGFSILMYFVQRSLDFDHLSSRPSPAALHNSSSAVLEESAVDCE
jgi:hypothetical protein